jgi:3-oxoacyl-[acyl-carrier protein] reductase
MFDLTGKIALVTGASSGIGIGIAEALHRQGATVVLTGRREAELNSVAAQLGERAHVIAADLADPAAPAALVEQVESAQGRLDILVNNAGFTRDMLALRMGDEDWNAVLEVDLNAPFRLARAALRGMMKRRAGRIVSIASIVGATGNAGQANYAAAKAGLVGMSKSLAQEVAPRGVTINVVAPGFIATPMTDKLGDAIKAAMMSRIPLARMGEAKDVAAAVVYLASDEAGWVTGTTIHVNGGMLML